MGIWQESPFGPFADVMVQQPSGHRQLLAPGPEVADFIAATSAVVTWDGTDAGNLAPVLPR